MNSWCKIHETTEHGQILIQKETNENDELTVKTTFDCMVGRVSVSISIEESDTEEESQGVLFDAMDKTHAIAGVTNIKEEMRLT